MNNSIAIVAAIFNEDVVGPMIEAATREIDEQGSSLVLTVKVAGSYELPLAVETVLKRSDVDVVVVLGFIEQGETKHGEVMGLVVHQKLLDSQLTHHKPIGLGIIGPGATEEQAKVRNERYARAAVRAAVMSVEALKGIAP